MVKKLIIEMLFILKVLLRFFAVIRVAPLDTNLSSTVHPPFRQCNAMAVLAVLKQPLILQLRLQFEWYHFSSKTHDQ